jgi:hypothetical protein
LGIPDKDHAACVTGEFEYEIQLGAAQVLGFINKHPIFWFGLEIEDMGQPEQIIEANVVALGGLVTAQLKDLFWQRHQVCQIVGGVNAEVRDESKDP